MSETVGTPKKGLKSSPNYRHRVPHTHYRLFARNVKIILDCIGKSQNSFAIDTGLKQPYVNKLFNGQFEPRLGTVFTIAYALGVPIEVILSTQVDVVKRFAEKLKKIRENDTEAVALHQ